MLKPFRGWKSGGDDREANIDKSKPVDDQEVTTQMYVI